MKTKLLFFASILLMVLNLQAQAPEKFNYQGIARDSNGDALANQTLGIRINILDAASTAVYVETHSVVTNAFGLYHIAIGNGAPITGTMAGVDWAGGSKKIKVEIDPNGGTNYTDLGTTDLLSVPYALYAAESSVSGGSNPIGAAGGDLTGNYPNPDIANDAVTSGKIDDATIVTLDLADDAITSPKILDGTIAAPDLANDAVTASKIADMGATTGQVLKYDGTNWMPSIDSEGNYNAGTGINISTANDISSTLGIDIDNIELQNDAVTTDKILDGTIAETDLANDAVASLKILDGTIITTDLADNAVTATKIADMGAAADQILKFDGTNWVPATDDSGTTYTAGTGIAISGTDEISSDLGIDIATAEIQDNAVTTIKIADANVTTTKLADNSITSVKINDGAVATVDLANDAVIAAKIAPMGATNGQVLKFDGTSWAPATDDPGAAGWELGGNAATGNDFFGTVNDEDLRFKVNNIKAGVISSGSPFNTAFGLNALASNTTGQSNVAIGFKALELNTVGLQNTAAGSHALQNNTTGAWNSAMGYNALQSNTTGSDNSAFGDYTLTSNTTGDKNTAMGDEALAFNATGESNTAIGEDALYSNIAGDYNVAIGARALLANTVNYNVAVGYESLFSNTTGGRNTATGYQSLYSNTTGGDNTAFGVDALELNTTGDYNTALGVEALQGNTSGIDNTAGGHHALYSNTWGDYNSAFGKDALYSNTQGIDNTAMGYQALYSFNTITGGNTAIGYQALYDLSGWSVSSTDSTGNTGLGMFTDVSDDSNNSTAIGYNANITGSNKIVLGNSFVTSIGGYAPWSNLSDARFKKDMKSLRHGLDFIMKLEPITYHINAQKLHQFMEQREGEAEEKDPGWLDEAMVAKAAIQYTGFSAQQVEKAAREIGYDFSGVHAPENSLDHYTLAYAEFVVPLVKAVQEQQEIIENQKTLNQAQEQTIQTLQEANEALQKSLAKIQARLSALDQKD